MKDKQKFIDAMDLNQWIKKVDLTPMQDDDEPDWDAPNGSEWIIAVDIGNRVSIISAPNIHYSFFDGGDTANDIGFPEDWKDVEPGVYRVTAAYSTSTCRETGYVDDHYFDVASHEKIELKDHRSKELQFQSV